jgi:tetratricopeptide (TPR) repeat protein
MLSSWRALYVEFLPLLGAVSLCGAQTVSKTYSQAAARIGSGDFQTGCKLAQAAVREAPGASAYNLAGLCATHAGHVAEAERLFRKSLSFNDKFPDARINLATNLAQRGMLQQAVEEFRLILRYDPKHVTALYNLGRLEMASASWTEAATHLEQACVLAPKDAAIAVSLAEAWVKAGKQNSPDRRAAAAMLSVARNAIAGRDIQTASVLLAATQVLAEDNAEWNALQGYVAFRRGSPEQALPRLQRALELAPGREEYYMKIGELLLFQRGAHAALAFQASRQVRAGRDAASAEQPL